MPQKRKTTLKVIACGSTVYLTRLHQSFGEVITGTVIAINIEFDKIQYQVEWFDKLTRNTAWFNETLVFPHITDSNIQTIGFHRA